MMLRRPAAAFVAASFLFAGGGVQAQQTAAPLPPIKVGIVWSYSGMGPVPGQDMDTAIATWQKEHGDTVAGRKIVFVKRDDTGLAPDVARRMAQDLILNEHVDFLAGLVWTANVNTVAPIADEAKVPLFLINASGNGIVTKYPYVARFSFSASEGPNQLGAWTAAQHNKTAVAVFQDSAGGIDAGTAFEKSFTAGGGKIVGEERVPQSAQEFSAYVERVKDAKPDVMFVYLTAVSGVGQFMKAVDQVGLRAAGVKIVSAGDFVAEPALPVIGDSALGIVSAYHYSLAHDSALNRQFIKDYTTIAPALTPTMVSVAAYDTFHAIYAIVAAQHGQLSPDKSMELVRGLKFESPRGPIVIDADTRDITQNIYIRRVEKRDGKLINAEFDTIPMVRSSGN
jgi:branched-chain amino acid transport system substrate-binding protein